MAVPVKSPTYVICLGCEVAVQALDHAAAWSRSRHWYRRGSRQMIEGVFDVICTLRAPGLEVVARGPKFLSRARRRFPVARPWGNVWELLLPNDDLHVLADQGLEFRQVQGFGFELAMDANGRHGLHLAPCCILSLAATVP